MESSVIEPLELLTNKQDVQKRFLTDIVNPAGCAILGFGSMLVLNWGLRKPVFSGIQKHIASACIGGVIGGYIDKKRNEILADRDAVLRHYVQLHPDDFPPVERIKYADVLEIWVPIR